MKIVKLEKIFEGDKPIVRLKIKTFFTKEIKTRDVVRSSKTSNYWEFMDNGESMSLYQHNNTINTFYESDFKSYIVNSAYDHI